MNILIICYCYPPDPGPRAYRWSAIAEYWAAQGDTVHVISARKQGAPEEEILNGVHVHRVGGAVTENLRLRLQRGKKQDAGTTVAPGGAPLSGTGQLFKAIHDVTWKKVYWPDSTCLWFFPARTMALKLCSEITFDAVISSSTPYTGHLVGRAVKQAHPKLPWTVDIGDPFSFGQPPWNNVRLFKGLNHRSERAVLNLADSVSVTVASCKNAYEEKFPGIASKISVIPPLFSGEVNTHDKSTPAKGCQLVFTGSLYRDIRNPAYLLELLAGVFAQAPDTQAHFYGRLNDCADLFEGPLQKFPNNLFVHGLVTRAAAAHALDDATILINIANRTRHQLPSKLVDYMASGKPIINMISIEDDNSLSFLKDYPVTATFMENSSADIAGDVARLCAFISGAKTVPQEIVAGMLRQFQLPAVEAQYRSLFDSDERFNRLEHIGPIDDPATIDAKRQ